MFDIDAAVNSVAEKSVSLSAVNALLDEVAMMRRKFLEQTRSFLDFPEIKKLACDYSKNLANRHVDLGFNAFAIISDIYHRENLHSDVIKAFLDPKGKHDEGDRFLRAFLEYLSAIDTVGARITPENYLNARIEREEGRIDILIADETSKHAIIIENKINGAGDMGRQIPRYLEYIKTKDYRCDAIIYLRLHGNGAPDRAGWSEVEKEEITGLLSVVSAYDELDSDLFLGWVKKCTELCKKGSNADFLLSQYSLLLKSLGKYAMNKPIMDAFYNLMRDKCRYRVALDVKATLEDLRLQLDEKSHKVAETVADMLGDLPAYRAGRITERFQSDCEPFSSVKPNGNSVFFTGMWRGNAHIGIDINCYPEFTSFGFWDRKDGAGKDGKAKDLLKKMDVLDEYKAKDGGGFFVKRLDFPEEDDALIQYIQTFKQELADVSPPEA